MIESIGVSGAVGPDLTSAGRHGLADAGTPSTLSARIASDRAAANPDAPTGPRPTFATTPLERAQAERAALPATVRADGPAEPPGAVSDKTAAPLPSISATAGNDARPDGRLDLRR